MIKFARALVLCTAPLVLLGCSETPQRPLADGYTLHGLVVDAETGAPVSDVTIRVGLEPDPEFHVFGVTDRNGAFLFKPSPATAPHDEIFRFERSGYASLDVPARTATRLEEYRYRLEARMQPER